jgi:hypothetical protein
MIGNQEMKFRPPGSMLTSNDSSSGTAPMNDLLLTRRPGTRTLRLWHITIFCLTLFNLNNSHADLNTEQRSNRQMAVTVCHDYRETNRLPCFVSRKTCPSGFEVIQKFSNSAGPSFSACRDKRHERPPRHGTAGNRFNTRHQQLLKQFDRLTREIEKQQTGASSHLPKASREKLALFFSGIDLSSITLAHSKALANGCFTDCRQIFCAQKNQIEAWTNPDTPIVSIKLLHQLAHVERCEIQGGRERFIQIWLRHLPDAIFTALKHGNPIDTAQVHYAIYMENHASNRAESICHRLGCVID